MASKKLITVFGSTGSQGGSVVEKFLNDPKLKNDWRVRGVTRDVNKESSKKLASKGVEVVSADMDDAKSLTKAIEGSDAVFAVTNYWEYMNREREEKQGRNLVDAAKAAGVKHFIFSSLINATKETNGKLSNIHHFDGKAEVEQYARAAGVPSTFFMPGIYVSVLANMFRKDENGGWTFAFPGPEATSQFPLFQPQDTGMWVKAIVLNKEKLLGGNVRAAAEYITPQQMLATFLKTYPEAGASARFYEVPKDQYLEILKGNGMPDFAAEELFENMQLLSIGGYYAGAKLSADLLDEGDEAVTFEKWVKTAKEFQGLN